MYIRARPLGAVTYSSYGLGSVAIMIGLIYALYRMTK